MRGFYSKVFLICFCISLSYQIGVFEAPFSQFPTYGTPSIDINPLPSYTERAMATMLNMARVDPAYYKANFYTPLVTDNSSTTSFNISNFNPTTPLYWNYNLNRVTRAHTNDLINCFMTVSDISRDCNNTVSFNRTINYFGSNTSISNLYAVITNYDTCYNNKGKRFWPLFSISLNLCIPTNHSCNGFSSCAIDSGSSVSRTIIMNSQNKQLGIGNTWLGKNTTFNADLSNIASSYSPAPKIVSGAHIFYSINSTNAFKYFAIVYAPTTITVDSVQVVIAGVPTDLTVTGTNSKQGVYVSASYTYTGTCTGYYFLINFNSSFTEKYPDQGEFRIYDETSSQCVVDWVENVTTTTPPSTLTPSTLTPSTLAPSTDVPSTNVPSTLTPSTNVPSNNVPSTDVPSTLTPSTNVPSNNVPSTDVPSTLTPLLMYLLLFYLQILLYKLLFKLLL
eukprot:TRINITY_DN2952_c0_g1_i1.p1 TRINITY_DN2952_c0_g1~~TRINITY_DN2952_c0_g1_i1.p1  ORF type:complete len:449 (+),score=21.02 TRINITY_DN2952_c0_g1_i1:53-1399(+)